MRLKQWGCRRQTPLRPLSRTPESARRVRGFTLVEVLVALVVMSVGMLGIAALYLEGLRFGRTAAYRTTAVQLAGDMADRIRANRAAGDAYAGSGPGESFGCVNGVVDCTPVELAAEDWDSWSTQLRSVLPEGADGAVEFVPGTPAVYTISVSWPEVGQAEPASYALTVQP